MKSVFNTRFNTTLILAAYSLVAFAGCSSHPSADGDFTPTPPPVSLPTAQSTAKPEQQVTAITMTYKNQASTINVTLDPYDENLNVQMTRSKDPAPATIVKRDTVFVTPPVQPVSTTVQTAPQPINVQVQLPPERHDTLRAKNDDSLSLEQSKAREQKLAANMDEVVADIRHAQEYFYKQDYSSAMRLAKAAQEIRPTAEGFALQGSIHYMLNDKPAARFYWTEALKLNPNIPEVTEALSKLDGAH